jgi:hypothetical protein
MVRTLNSKSGEGMKTGTLLVRWTLIILLLTGGSVMAADTIYTWTDEQGVKRFSDQPPGADVGFESIPSVSTTPPADGEREAFTHMMRQVEQTQRQRDMEAQEQAAARAEQARKRSIAERQARIDAERTRLQEQIDALNHRALSPTFTQGMRQARIDKIREEMDALEAEE